MKKTSGFPLQNPNIVLREEEEGWAMLFDPDSGETYGLDLISTFIWKKLDGKNSIEDIIAELKKACADEVPKSITQDVVSFITDLAEKGLVTI